MFSEFLRTRSHRKKQNYNIIKLATDNNKLLSKGSSEFNGQLLLAYTLKMFEKFIDDFGPGSEIHRPKSFAFNINDYKICIDIDAVIFSTKTIRKHKKRIRKTNITMCFLIPSESWSIADISSRFENLISAKYIWPALKSAHDTYEILYFCPDSGKRFIIPASVFKRRMFTIDRNRLTDLCQGIYHRNFIRHPVGVKCDVCPVKDLCQPADYMDRNKIEQVLPQISL